MNLYTEVRSWKLLGALLLVLGLLGAQPAHAANVQCGDTIAHDTKLDGDLDCTGAGFALTVDSNVTLDLNGHIIRQSGPFGRGISIGHPISGGGDNATVVNGRIEGIATVDQSGFRLLSCIEGVTGFGQGMTVKGVQIANCSNGITLFEGTHNRVIDNQILDFTESQEDLRWGILVGARRSETEPPPPITANIISGNVVFNSAPAFLGDEPRRFAYEIGIGVYRGGDDVVERNVTSGTAFGIHVEADRTAVERNLATRSDLIAMELFTNGGQAVRNRVKDDRGSAAGGIGIFVGQPADIERNIASGFSVDGIKVRDVAQGAVLSKNRTNFDGNYGIEAVPGTVDGGGNKASGNGNPAQCVNVFCK